MQIQYQTGNLLNTPYTLILHGCNAQGVMNSGVARAIRTKFPQAYQQYRKHYEDQGLRLGTIIPVYCDEKIIINGITQKYYGRDSKCYISYDAINNVIRFADKYASDNGHNHIAMPLIGAGLGGGSWNRISKIVEENTNFAIPVVYTLDGKIPD